MKTPKVSVIVPNYNHSRFLRQRIDSILDQKYQDFELILLDDCSSDQSREILSSYQANSHVSHVVFNNVNSGNPFLQWVKGIELSIGEYIWIAESDDVADEDFLMTLIPMMEEDPKSVIAFSHSYLLDENGIQINNDFHGQSNPDEVKYYNGDDFARRIMTTCNYIFNASMVVFRRSAYACVNGEFVHYRTCGDWAFWMSICLQGNVIEVGRRLSYFRQHEDKMTIRAGQTGDDWLDVAGLLTAFIRQLHLTGLSLRIYRGQWTKHFRESHYPNKQRIINAYPKVFDASRWDVLLYQLSKLLKKILKV